MKAKVLHDGPEAMSTLQRFANEPRLAARRFSAIETGTSLIDIGADGGAR